MTVLVGVRCHDGIVIGADSAVTYGLTQPQIPTAEVAAARKIYVIHEEIVMAGTGEVGLCQRLYEMLNGALRNAENRQQFLNASPVDAGVWISATAAENFKKTSPPWAESYQLGALVGVVIQQRPRLYWFDGNTFRPELIGERDYAGRFRTPPLITHGSGQLMADPFLLQAHRVLFGEDHLPTVAEGRLLVAWTLQHVINYNTGGVGGSMSIVALEQNEGAWKATEVDEDEMIQSVKDIEAHIRGYGKAAPEEEIPNIDAELDAESEQPADAQQPNVSQEPNEGSE